MSYDVYETAGEEGGVNVEAGMLPRGGIVLRDMRHHVFSWAKQARVIGIWVFPRDTKRFQPKFLTLGPPDFEQTPHFAGKPSEPWSIERTWPGLAPKPFHVFNTISELTAQFISRGPLFEDGRGKSGFLTVRQQILFTDYSNSPSHEPAGSVPGGAVTATRFFPLLSFEYTDDGYVNSIRADFYVHLRLDGSVDASLAPSTYNSLNRAFPNQAGVFKDDDSQLGPFRQMSSGEQDLQFAFDALEKPIKTEICSLGLVHGSKSLRLPPNSLLSVLDEQDQNEKGIESGREGWDNIHWWGSRGKGNPIISAIGAFHAGHLHWRWAIQAQQLPRSIAGQFRGINPDRGGPLLDPQLPDQTVRFAIAKHSDKRDPDAKDLADLSKTSFSELFHRNNYPSPSPINLPDSFGNEGANIVLWFSTEAYPRGAGVRLLSTAPPSLFGGTLFVHGFFFAHEAEPSPWTLGAIKTGSTTPEEWDSPDVGKWLRLAGLD
jgi:hypothetical protein